MKTVGLNKKTINDVPLDGETVLLRADYNVPLGPDGQIADDYRMRMSLPTLHNLIDRGCKIVVCAHLGRPKGEVKEEFSLEPVAKHLVDLLEQPVKFVSDCIGDRPYQAANRLKPGEVLLLENLRFHSGEEANDPDFAKALAKASRARYFIQDGFGVVHRAHASTDAITHFLPSVAGLLLKKEIDTISITMENPARPLVAIMGGAKISDKIKVVKRFVELADQVVIGGAMANTFLAEKGINIGASLSETGLEDTIRQVYAAAEGQSDKLLLPLDVAVGKSTDQDEPRRDIELNEVAADDKILDIGPKTIDRMTEVIAGAKTVVWNGTLGFAELDQFAHGSARAALELAKRPDIESIIGGGDTADFVLKGDAKHGGSFSHVSTGGGASLDLMAGEKLPGVEALLDA